MECASAFHRLKDGGHLSSRDPKGVESSGKSVKRVGLENSCCNPGGSPLRSSSTIWKFPTFSLTVTSAPPSTTGGVPAGAKGGGCTAAALGSTATVIEPWLTATLEILTFLSGYNCTSFSFMIIRAGTSGITST